MSKVLMTFRLKKREAKDRVVRVAYQHRVRGAL
jgi:hypothetical protein